MCAAHLHVYPTVASLALETERAVAEEILLAVAVNLAACLVPAGLTLAQGVGLAVRPGVTLLALAAVARAGLGLQYTDPVIAAHLAPTHRAVAVPDVGPGPPGRHPQRVVVRVDVERAQAAAEPDSKSIGTIEF